MSDRASDLQLGEWQALRGELVALLYQVENRYSRVDRAEPALDDLTERVRNLRDQVVGPEPATHRREAMRTVKRAVNRFSDRDEASRIEDAQDALRSAIAEIRGRQISGNAAALGRHVTDMPEFRELSRLVGGLSARLEQLESKLKLQRVGNDSVDEVAGQVEQLTHVVELLASAVGETGQVKRLESQIAALAALIEKDSKADLSAINKRLDDVSGTVAKLAELQAQQMEREVIREDRLAAAPATQDVATLAPAIRAIETGVRNVYDRIDSIEKNVPLSSGDFERLTAEMAAFTQAMKNRETAPGALVSKVDALAARIGDFQAANGDVASLKQDVSALREAVMAGMEPRFNRIESQIEALSERVAPGSIQVEDQLKLLMRRMHEIGTQLNSLAKLSAAPKDGADIEVMATLIAERTSQAVANSAPGPTTDSVSRDSMSALERRMTALSNRAAAAQPTAPATSPAKSASTLTVAPAACPTPPAPAPEMSDESRDERLEAMLAALGNPDAESDSMPTNPGDDVPLIDSGFKGQGPVSAALAAKVRAMPPSFVAPEPVITTKTAVASVYAALTQTERRAFEPGIAERPPRPQSSFAQPAADSFQPIPSTVSQVEAQTSQNSTSTFVAAARRAQRARAEAAAPDITGDSVIGRALSRFMLDKSAAPAAKKQAPLVRAEKPAKPPKAPKQAEAAKLETVIAPSMTDAVDDAEAQPSFLVRYRRSPLLAATLIAVSMLALNLVMQRMAPAQPQQPTLEALAVDATQTAAPSATPNISLVQPEPRIIDMIDDTVTASINPNVSSFTRSATPTMPMPPTLLANARGNGTTFASSAVPLDASDVTRSIPGQKMATRTFDLLPEAVGPLELRQAAANGDARAQFEVAAIFSEGRAIEQDYSQAAVWYERAAAHGFAPAQYRLGNLYEIGTGVDKDLEVARLWYQRAAEAHNRMAMHNLAALYAGGQIGEQALETAAEWFERAASQGMTGSQFNLGMLYARGLGVQQDFEQSYKWLALAALGGDADAAEAREGIAKSLSIDAISRVGAEVVAWKASPIDLAANFAPIGTWSDKFSPGEAITSRDVIAKVQLALGKLGFDIGAPDGLAGPKTAEAIRAFERGTGMSETGGVNPRLLAVLGSHPV
ncbi:MAG: peptidoglycan-binding protein [Candidatus Devosia symbiotica]|nr:peptidoglycan-binding protein [Candidatus Devosia symbiotica]